MSSRGEPRSSIGYNRTAVDRQRIKRAVQHGLALAALWALPPLINGIQQAVDARMMNKPFSYLPAVAFNLPRWMLWIAFTPAIMWLTRRVPLTSGPIGRRIAIHGSALAAIVVLMTCAWALSLHFSSPEWKYEPVAMFTLLVPVAFLWSTALYAAIAAVTTAIDSRKREQALETQLVEVRLESLRRQLQPHFFFNTLHTISGLVRVNRNSEAIAMIARLGELMRETVADSRGQETTLRRELELLELYLEIQRIRFADRLEVRIHASEETLNAAVPVLLLQPLAENAVDHGISNRPGGGWLEFQSSIDGPLLLITIRNSGRVDSASQSGNGVGLRNTRERLRTLYGSSASIELNSDEAGSVAAIVRIPFRPRQAA